jgi:hypothetical protein
MTLKTHAAWQETLVISAGRLGKRPQRHTPWVSAYEQSVHEASVASLSPLPALNRNRDNSSIVVTTPQ